MSVLLRRMWKNYGYLINDVADPRTKDWFLVSNPFNIVLVLVIYNYFCTTIGPNFMKNRQPYKLKNIIRLYNLLQIFLSVYIFREICYEVFYKDFSFKCHRLNESNDKESLRTVSASWLYYMAKLTELLDTLFFVLKKSSRQVSFLHLFHHTSMAMAGWIGTKYFPGGQSVIIGWINTFIHIIMYTYYLIASLGPEFKKYLWWKKYLTVMQIIQFGLISIQYTVSLFFDCGFPTTIKLLVIAGTSSFTWMFSSFYYNIYMKKEKNESI